MKAEPTLSEVHADLVGRLKQDERLRAVETQQAAMGAVISELPRMEERLMAAIQEAKPKNVSAWVAVAVSAAALVLGPLLAAAVR